MGEKTKPRSDQRSRAMSLNREQAVYEANLPRWVSNHEGKYVLIKGDEVVGFYGSRDEALAAGYIRFGIGPLFVKQVRPPSRFITFPTRSSDAPHSRPDRRRRTCHRLRHLDRPRRGPRIGRSGAGGRALPDDPRTIDTGADRTAIHPHALTLIGSPPRGRSGSADRVPRPPLGGSTSTMCVLHSVAWWSRRWEAWVELEVAAVVPADPNVLALIGRDMLRALPVRLRWAERRVAAGLVDASGPDSQTGSHGFPFPATKARPHRQTQLRAGRASRIITPVTS